jgi:hypothetical protein
MVAPHLRALRGHRYALPKLHGGKRRDKAFLRRVRCAAAVSLPDLRLRQRARRQVLRRLWQTDGHSRRCPAGSRLADTSRRCHRTAPLNQHLVALGVNPISIEQTFAALLDQLKALARERPADLVIALCLRHGAPPVRSTPRGADDTCRPLATAKVLHHMADMRKNQFTNYYSNNDRSMPNGDPRIFEFPCRFPAAPSIRSENRDQGFDRKRLFDTGRTSKKFLP